MSQWPFALTRHRWHSTLKYHFPLKSSNPLFQPVLPFLEGFGLAGGAQHPDGVPWEKDGACSDP